MVGSDGRFQRLTPKQIPAKHLPPLECECREGMWGWQDLFNPFPPLFCRTRRCPAPTTRGQGAVSFLCGVGIELKVSHALGKHRTIQRWRSPFQMARTAPSPCPALTVSAPCKLLQDSSLLHESKPFHPCDVLAENEMMYGYILPEAEGFRQWSLGLFNSLTLIHPKVSDCPGP